MKVTTEPHVAMRDGAWMAGEQELGEALEQQDAGPGDQPAGFPSSDEQGDAGDSWRITDLAVGGTLVWYYYICLRQVWLLAHQIVPDQDHTNLTIGRFIGQIAYSRQKKELTLGASKMDIYQITDEGLVIGEVKKSSRYARSARMQLLFYLRTLASVGIQARGELRFPTEKLRQPVALDEAAVQELDEVEREILRVARQDKPPPATKSRYCKGCAYVEFCWS